jgi:integrase
MIQFAISLSTRGFRASARTMLDEQLGYPAHLIEHQLAHAVKDANGRAYNRTSHLPERRAMMQCWADYLDKLSVGATVLTLRAAA